MGTQQTVVVVHNDLSTEIVPTKVKQLLRNHPRSAYTTMEVDMKGQLVDVELHVVRLLKSIKAMDESLDGLFQRFLEYVESMSGEHQQEVLRKHLDPYLRACLHRMNQNEVLSGMIVVCLAPSDCKNDLPGTLPLEVSAFGCAYSPIVPLQKAAKVVILGGPRQIPIAKDTQWVNDRVSLEEKAPPDADEVLLCSKDGGVLEGLITNFYVVRRIDDGPIVVETAPMSSGVVWGTMRVRVLEACRSLGLLVVEREPCMEERETWVEAFLTNSLRHVQAIREIECHKANIWGLPEWDLTLNPVPGQITGLIDSRIRSTLQSK